MAIGLRRLLGKLRGVVAPKPAPAPKPVPRDVLLEGLLRRGTRIAAIVRLPDQGERRGWVRRARAAGAEVDVLPLAQPYRRADGAVMSFVYRPPRDAYDAIVVDPYVTLYEHSWSYAFLDRLNALLDANGALFLDTRKSLISPARLEALFGSSPQPSGNGFVVFAKAADGLARPPEAPLSTLDTYWPLMDRLMEERYDPKLARVIRRLGAAKAAMPLREEFDILAALQSQSYRTNSVRTKAASVQHIASVFFPGRRDLHLADIGAGTGLNSMELLLNDSGVASLTLVEIVKGYHWPIAAVYRRLGERVQDKVTLVDKPGERYESGPADIAMICSVLSAVPRANHSGFTQNVWDNLAPGGVVAVFENMRDSDPAEGDFRNDNRFTPEEIDTLLGRFAPVRYFGQMLKELEPGEAGNETVFRVIRKPPA